MTYCFKCRACGATFELPSALIGDMLCSACGKQDLVRDYKTEGAQVGVSVLASRGGTARNRNVERSE